MCWELSTESMLIQLENLQLNTEDQNNYSRIRDNVVGLLKQFISNKVGYLKNYSFNASIFAKFSNIFHFCIVIINFFNSS